MSKRVHEYLAENFNFKYEADWLLWPPNTFAVTSNLLKNSGAYRVYLSSWWLSEDANSGGNLDVWQSNIETGAAAWCESICSKLCAHFDEKNSGPTNEERLLRLKDQVKLVNSDFSKDITLNDLRSLGDSRTSDSDKKTGLYEFIRALIEIHCIADECCKGVGLTGLPANRANPYILLSNLYLITNGSLSTINKHVGIVLPKMRTSQKGLSIRSFSHHAMFQDSEVEVMWRMFPWANIQEDTLNVLNICWPFEVNNNNFDSASERFEKVQRFNYSSQPKDKTLEFETAMVINTMEGYREKGIRRIHMIVMPEASLTIKQFNKLLIDLVIYYRRVKVKQNQKLEQLPIIICGVSTEPTKEERGRNELYIASFFADSWYSISQHKHHRWKMDSNQIRQYGLSSRMSTSRDWFENIDVPQRRLSIVAPNGWLTICPLICEDLAQLDPMANLIRGIGPTMLIALLADGPQLAHRWPGRYSSLFTDDPGTSVLTITSSGMLGLSRPINGEESDTSTVCLWRDQINGTKQIKNPEISSSTRSQHHVLTLSTAWIEEITVDGRSDHMNASVIAYQNETHFDEKDLDQRYCQRLKDIIKALDKHTSERKHHNAPKSSEEKPSEEKPFEERLSEDGLTDKTWNDIREVSCALSIMDYILDCNNLVQFDIVLTFIFGVKPGEQYSSHTKEQYISISSEIHGALFNPSTAGIAIEENSSDLISLTFKIFIACLKWSFQQLCTKSIFTASDDLLVRYELWYEFAQPAEKPDSIPPGLSSNIKSVADLSSDDLMDHIRSINRMRLACSTMIKFLLHDKLDHSRKNKLSGENPFTQKRYDGHMHEPNHQRLVKLFNEIEQDLIQDGY